MQCAVLIVGKTDVKMRCETSGRTLDREETLTEYEALTPESLAQRLGGLNAMVEKIRVDVKINNPPKTKNCTSSDIVSENRNPGNKARKKMVTFGFKTFIKNPMRNNCAGVFF